MATLRRALADQLRDELQIETEHATPLEQIFEEEPPPLDVFVTDPLYLNNMPLSPIQYDFVRHFEQILDPSTYVLMTEEWGEYWQPVRFTNYLVAEWGKGSGKDHCCQIAFARVSNILLSLKSPHAYYGLPHQSIVHLMNVAASAPQAHGVFFKPLRSLITRSRWFSDKFEVSEPSPQAAEIRFAKQLELISGHSQAETLEGKNLIAAIADEISAFPTLEEVKINRAGRAPSKTADGIIDMLRSSATTRFPENFKLAQISFPRFKGDAIEQAVAKGKADNLLRGPASRYYVSGPKATWDVNPRFDPFPRIEVVGATEPVPDLPSIVEDYEKDPAYARAKYECRPELAENRFFANDAAIYAALGEARTAPPIEVEYYWGLDEAGHMLEAFGSSGSIKMVPGWQVRFHYAPDFRPVAGALYCVHGDMALVGDRAGVAMAHVRTWEERDWALGRQAPTPEGPVNMERRPVVKMDFCTAFEADATGKPGPREVQIRWYRKLVWELRARGFHIAQVSYDGFQSADSMQILESWGIPSAKASTDRNNELYDSLRDVMYDGRLEGYHHELLIQELRRLSKLRNGKIDHPPGFCFVGETRIPLLDGTSPMISELEGSKVWVYSAKPTGEIVPGFATARKTKMAKHLVDVVLDSGYVARCTPEHLWMLRDGTYKEAQCLVPGVDRLMPITFGWPRNGGYEAVTDLRGVRSMTHHLVAEHMVGRSRLPGEHVHHLNEDKTDNRPENLQILTHAEHVRTHGIERWEARREAMVAGHQQWSQSDRFAEDMAKRDMSWAQERDWQATARKHPLYRQDVTIESLREVLEALNANDAARRLSCGRNVVMARLREAGYSSWDEFKSMADNNHKVRRVIPVVLDSPVPVYDLEVDEWHNFALTGGVFVHNSKDLADALAGAVSAAVKFGGDEGEEVLYSDEGNDFDFLGTGFVGGQQMKVAGPDIGLGDYDYGAGDDLYGTSLRF